MESKGYAKPQRNVAHLPEVITHELYQIPHMTASDPLGFTCLQDPKSHALPQLFWFGAPTRDLRTLPLLLDSDKELPHLWEIWVAPWLLEGAMWSNPECRGVNSCGTNFHNMGRNHQINSSLSPPSPLPMNFSPTQLSPYCLYQDFWSDQEISSVCYK